MPGIDGASEPFQPGDAGRAGPVEALQALFGAVQVGRPVDVPELLGGEVGGGDVAGRVAGVQADEQPALAGLGLVLLAAQQHPADPVERVVLAAAVAQGLVLHAATDRVDRGVGELDGVEAVPDHGRRGQLAANADR